MLFGTSGIRGDAKKLFNDQFCFDIGRTFSIFLEDHRERGDIAIGIDPRESSERIKDSIVDGILYENENRRIFDEGISPAPAINYILIVDHSIAGGIMVTGSHIRRDFNGVKFFYQHMEILKEYEKKIEKIYEDIKEKVDYKNIGKRHKYNMIYRDNRANEFYQKMLLGIAGSYPKWKIVLDLGNGCQSKVMPELFKKLGVDTVIINNIPQPDKFIARDTETEDAVKGLQEKVIEEKADLGIAFDGDGDRAVFVDKDGKFIPGDYIGTLIAKYSNSPVVITPINTSQIVEHIGKTVIRTKVGSPYVIEAMEKNMATFGFESNGGGISKEIMMSRDAGSVMIKILNILNKTGKTLNILIDEFPQSFICKTKVDCPINIYPIILKSVREKFAGIRIDDIDGLKIWKDDDCWILFRPSSNAPEFRVFAEANSREEALKLCKEGIALVCYFRDANI